jgi:hypothetical protein
VQYTWSCSAYFCHDCFAIEHQTKHHRRYVCTYTVHKLDGDGDEDGDTHD